MILYLSGCAALDSTSTHPGIQKPPLTDSISGEHLPEEVAASICPEEVTGSICAEEATASIGVVTPHDDAVAPLPVQAPESNLWDNIRSGFRLPDKDKASVTRHIRRYARHTRAIEGSFQLGEPYLAYIYNEVDKRGFPSEIALLPFIESNFNPQAHSPKRAAGLWQFIPRTARHYGLKQDWWYDGRRDVVASTRAALEHLEKMHQKFGGDWLLALAAYNAGGKTVRNAIRKNRRAGKPVDYWSLKLPRETASYVPRLLAISVIVAAPADYGVHLSPLYQESRFTLIDLPGQINLEVAAEMAGMTVGELQQLNPGYQRWATHPEGPQQLAIPQEKSAIFEQNLAALPASERMKWVRHKIRPGETLSHIAHRYDTTVPVLRASNRLHSNTIRAGHHLLVPVAARVPVRHAALEPDPYSDTNGNEIRYRVSEGDNLSTIAQHNGVSVRQLTAWNALDPRAFIRPGQLLVIRQHDTAPRPFSYTVRKGDSLFLISRRFNVTIADIREWNTLPEGKYLQPGQRLQLFIDNPQGT
jgi:membrane-bound lytic murein transglycosylase D